MPGQPFEDYKRLRPADLTPTQIVHVKLAEQTAAANSLPQATGSKQEASSSSTTQALLETYPGLVQEAAKVVATPAQGPESDKTNYKP